jgi:putative phosphoesterase
VGYLLNFESVTVLNKLTKIVGLISDTHIPTRASKISPLVFDIFKDVDYILHAGDLVQLDVIDQFEQLAPVYAVHGNMDGIGVREQLPWMNKLKIYDWKLGVTHDPGIFYGRGRMREMAEENKVNIFVYGHTHHPSIRWDTDILFINPGSPTNPLPPFVTKPTVARLELTRENVQPRIISLTK